MNSLQANYTKVQSDVAEGIITETTERGFSVYWEDEDLYENYTWAEAVEYGFSFL